jgi:hypothetical protein
MGHLGQAGHVAVDININDGNNSTIGSIGKIYSN